jgi:hypothetical protein
MSATELKDERGIYRKYTVTRTDGSSGPDGKHEHCNYFVLDLAHDKFALPALKAYRKACAKEFPALAQDLSYIVTALDNYDEPNAVAETLMSRGERNTRPAEDAIVERIADYVESHRGSMALNETERVLAGLVEDIRAGRWKGGK